MLKFLIYAVWAAAAGAQIPVMAVLNARLGRVLGEPAQAPVILFLVGLFSACAVSLLGSGKLPDPQPLAQAKLADFAGGLIVCGYVVSVTLLAPSFGIGNLILFAVASRIVTSAVIDNYGLLGSAIRPVNGLRMLGLAAVLTGLAISQIAANSNAVMKSE
jgi:bacterial/archaeal transporter family-2 protein